MFVLLVVCANFHLRLAAYLCLEVEKKEMIVAVQPRRNLLLGRWSGTALRQVEGERTVSHDGAHLDDKQ